MDDNLTMSMRAKGSYQLEVRPIAVGPDLLRSSITCELV